MLTISPNTTQEAVVGIPVCFEGSGIVTIPQEDLRALDLAASGTNWTYDSTNLIYKKTSGTNGTFTDAFVTTNNIAYGLQPFYIQGCNSSFVTPHGSNNNSHWVMGVEDDDGNFYNLEVMKYCNSNNSSCGSASNPGQTWVMSVNTTQSGMIYTRSVNFNEKFYIRSDGINLYFEHIQGGVLLRDVSIVLPTTTTWRFRVSAAYVGNEMTCAAIFKGSYQGSVPITWSAPDGGTLVPAGGTACFHAGSTGTYRVCIDSDFDDPLCVSVHVAALNFVPVGLACGNCVFVNDVVHFTSNGGQNGVLTVVDSLGHPSGTVIDALTWQAPTAPTTATFTYTLGGSTVTCVISVIEHLQLLNFSSDTITGLVPGDIFPLITNYAYPDVVWENLDCANIVTPEGYVAIPRRLNDECFGALDCHIRCRLVGVSGVLTNPGVTGCTNLIDGSVYFDLRVITDPVYPTPEFGGPNPIKWKPETPEYKVLINEFDGGCDETYLKNRVGIYRWTVAYNGLAYKIENPCEPQPCCDDTQGFIDGYDQTFQTAERLDKFWNTVAGTAGYFTLKDFRTGHLWRRVRFDGVMERDHINWRTSHSRTVKMVWHPCCDTEPLGGTCIHTIVADLIPPTVPQNIAATAFSHQQIDVSWTASTDNVGIKYYELFIDGEIVNVNNVVLYHHTQLEPVSTHSYKVRAYDFDGNYSPWSDVVTATTPDVDTTPPTIPGSFAAPSDHISQLSFRLTWTASTDNIGIGGYIILCNGEIFSVGNRTQINFGDIAPKLGGHTIGPEVEADTDYVMYIRAIDVNGLKSPWSGPVSVHTLPYPPPTKE